MIEELNRKFEHEHRKVLITEVTRMTAGLVCVAGIDLSTGRMVRPLQPGGQNWEEKKWVDTGYMRVGNVVGLEPHAMPKRTLPHRNEDYFVTRIARLGDTTSEELFSACNEMADVDIHTALHTHLHDNKFVLAGAPCPSLFCIILPKNTVKLSDKYDRMQFSFPSEHGWYNLPVTDLAAKSAGNATAGVENIQERIDGAASAVAIRLGLAREWAGQHNEYNPKRCYLQVNGLAGN